MKLLKGKEGAGEAVEASSNERADSHHVTASPMLTGWMGECVSTPSALGIRTDRKTSPETPSLRDWSVGETSVDATDHGPWWLRANPIILVFVSVMDAAGENQTGSVYRIGIRFRICGAGGRPVQCGAYVDGLCSAIGLHALPPWG